MSLIILKNAGLYPVSILPTWVHLMFPQDKNSNETMLHLQKYHQNCAVLLDTSHLWARLTCLVGSGTNLEHLDTLVFFKSSSLFTKRLVIIYPFEIEDCYCGEYSDIKPKSCSSFPHQTTHWHWPLLTTIPSKSKITLIIAKCRFSISIIVYTYLF